MMMMMTGVLDIIRWEGKRTWKEAGGLRELSEIKGRGKFVVRTWQVRVKSQGQGRR